MAKVLSSSPRMTVDQFLAWPDEGPEGARYELVAGEVVAMAPERAAHARIKLKSGSRCARASSQAIWTARRCQTA